MAQGRKRKAGATYTALDNVHPGTEFFRFDWEMDQVHEIDKMFELGFNAWEIAEKFKRDPDEVIILAIDRVKRKKIKKAYGLFRR